MTWQVQLKTLEETQALGTALARVMQVPLTLALCGPLGAGKTELVRSLAAGLGVPREQVTSPTYVLMQRYSGTMKMIHLDFYRLKSIEEVWDLGIDEWLAEPVVTVIEWADKFPAVLPEDVLRCDLSQAADGSRLASFTAKSPRAQAVLDQAAATFPK